MDLQQYYKDLTCSRSASQLEMISTLEDEKLFEVLRLHENSRLRGYKFETLRNKLRSEIFKRKGLGKATGVYLSFIQRDYLKALGLYPVKQTPARSGIVDLSQAVKLSGDGLKEITQHVYVDFNDGWLCVGNDNNEISLSIENWHHLRQLVEKALK